VPNENVPARHGGRVHPPDIIIANPPFGSSAGGARARRSDLPFPTSNKQLLFLQHIYLYLALKPGGRAAVVVPDNVLFEEGVGRRVRTHLMKTCDVQTCASTLRQHVGWIPTANGRLSFRHIGEAKHPTPSKYANVATKSDRIIVAYQRRNLSDSVFRTITDRA
jgi:hypothetical protein